MSEKKSHAQSEIDPYFHKILLWPEYESFRAIGLVFLIVENIVLGLANLSLFFSWSVGPIIAVIGILLAVIAVYQAIVFVERAKSHFSSQPKVRQAIERSEEKLAQANHWGRFFRTIDGQLFALAALQLALVAGQLWLELH